MLLAALFWLIAYLTYDENLIAPIAVGVVTLIFGGIPGFVALVVLGVVLRALLD